MKLEQWIQDEWGSFPLKSVQIGIKDGQCAETNEKIILRFLFFQIWLIIQYLRSWICKQIVQPLFSANPDPSELKEKQLADATSPTGTLDASYVSGTHSKYIQFIFGRYCIGYPKMSKVFIIR